MSKLQHDWNTARLAREVWQTKCGLDGGLRASLLPGPGGSGSLLPGGSRLWPDASQLLLNLGGPDVVTSVNLRRGLGLGASLGGYLML